MKENLFYISGMLRMLPSLILYCGFLSPALFAQIISVPTKYSLAIPHQYDDAHPFSGGLAAVKKRGKWGFIDHEGTVKVEFEWDEVRNFLNGSAAVRRGNEWFFIDITGKIRTPVLEKVDNFDGIMKGKLHGKWGTFNPDFSVGIPFVHNSLMIVNEQFIQVDRSTDEESKCVLNWEGDTIIPSNHIFIHYNDSIFLAMNLDRESAFFDTRGNALCPYKPGFVYLHPFVDGITKAKQDGNYFIMNKKFQTIASGFSYLGDVNDGQIIAEVEGLGPNRSGIYDYRVNMWHITPKYRSIAKLNRETYSCSLLDSMYLIDRQGTLLASLKCLYGTIMSGSSVVLRGVDLKEGCYSLEHQKLLPTVHDEVQLCHDGSLILVRDAYRYSIYNAKMECLVSGLDSVTYPLITENKFPVRDENKKVGFLIFE